MDKVENVTGEENNNVQDAAGQQDAAVQSGEPSRDNPNAEDFRGMRSSLKEMKGENETFRNENAVLRNEMTQMREAITQAYQQKKVDPFEGRDDTDYLTIADQKRNDSALREDMLREKSALNNQADAMFFKSSHPDYEEVMNKYGKLLPIELRNFLVKNPNDPDAMKAAYSACKDGVAYYKDNMSTAEHDNVKRAAENMAKPGAGSSTGSGGTLSLVNKLKNMTSEERVAYSDRCIREGGR